MSLDTLEQVCTRKQLLPIFCKALTTAGYPEKLCMGVYLREILSSHSITANDYRYLRTLVNTTVVKNGR